MSLIGSNNEQKIWNYLKSKGLNDYGISGLMGNIVAESGLNPMNLQNTYEKSLKYSDEEYCKAVDNGTYTNFVQDKAGWGLCQWTFWSRKENLLKFAQANRKSIGDLEMQLDFLWKELSESYKSVLNVLKTATSVLEASNAVLLNFERPAKRDEEVQNKRAGFGKVYFDKYATVKDQTTSTGGNGKMKYSANNKPIVCMMTNSTCYKGTRKMNVLGVLWHSTGANNPWLKRYVQPSDNASDRAELIELIGKNTYGNDWNHINRQAGLNCWIGKLADGTVATVQTMPWDYRPWGCGSGSKGSCNNGWIQFEICEDALTDKTYFDKVYKEACEITAYLCDMYDLDPNGTVTMNGVKVPVILCHADSYNLGLGSNHGDVLHWFKKHGKTMADVRKDVAALMGSASTDTPTTPTTPVQPETPVTTEMYRVRKAWADSKSQIGAYRDLNNAKVACDKAGAGYYVFNSAGKAVYPVVDKLEVGDEVTLVSGAKYTSGATPKPWVYTSTLYVRELRNNDTVAVISTKKTGDITGVVYVKDLKQKGQTSTVPATPAFQAYKVKVTANVLNIRKGAGTNYGIAGAIKDKGIYTIVAESTGKGATKWGKLKSGAGWISLDYCEKI